MQATAIPQAGRVDWVDYAKGYCIVLVVLMHSTLGVENAVGHEGWLHHVTTFARPFRMPDFFLICGLFVGRAVEKDWRRYLDGKVLHFAYFYTLWVTIEFLIRGPGMAWQSGIGFTLQQCLMSFIEPFGSLWFIYLLPFFLVTAKLVRRAPPLIIWSIAAGLEIAHLHTGWTAIDEYANRFVYFYTGYLMAPHIFSYAAQVQKQPMKSLALLGLWGMVNGFFVYREWAELPLVSLVLGYLGALAVVALAALMARTDLMQPIRYCGRNSIVIYLAFFLFMGATRAVLIRLGVISDVGTLSALVTFVSILGPLLLFWSVRDTRLRFLFERPASLRLEPRQRVVLQPAE